MRCRILLFLLFLVSFANAQIRVVPNPSAPDIYAWTGTGIRTLSGYAGNPIVLNGKLVVEYNYGSTSDVYSSAYRLQLAVYDGSNYTRIQNPDSGNVYPSSIHIIFNNKLFFIYVNQSGIQQMASFDGTAVTLYPNPDGGPGYIGSPRIFNGELYGSYVNAQNVTQYAKFNGSSLVLIPNPDNSNYGFEFNYSVVFGNKIVSRYVTAAGPKALATFDGTSWTILPNPDATTAGVFSSFPGNYHNKLYWRYYSATGQYQFLEYDGTNNPKLIANPQNSASNHGGVIAFPVVLNDTLFFQYYNTSGVYQLAKFGGTSISLVANPDASPYGYWWVPAVYNNNLYIIYLATDNLRHLAGYQPASNSIKIYPNPDGGIGDWDFPFVYGDKLYMMYSDASSQFRLSYFDGSSVKLIDNPGGVYNSTGNNGYMGSPVVFNNLLYMQFGSVPYGYAGNLASFDGSVLPVKLLSFTGELKDNKAVLTWKTANETNNKGFTLQRSADGIQFTDVAFINGKGNQSSGSTYSYTDVKLLSGSNYYRLLQTDIDGSASYSSIVKLDYARFSWYVLNNMPGGQPQVQLQLENLSKVSVQMIAPDGSVVQSILKGNLSAGTYSIPLSLKQAGIYTVCLLVNDKVYTSKVIR